MSITLAFILGIIQALTEFLPVSSSGHLVVGAHYLSGFFSVDNVPLAFDVTVHLATLVVTILFLKDDLFALFKAMIKNPSLDKREGKLLLLLVIASIPSAIVGLGFKSTIEVMFDSPRVAAYGWLLTTFVLLLAHILRKESSPGKVSLVSDTSWKLPTVFQALVVGIAQAIAIIPGVSRSGSTIATGLILKLPAESALRFSFLISLPAIAGAGLLEARNIVNLDSSNMIAYTVGFIATFIVGWFSIRWLVIFTKKSKLIYFAIYTLILSSIVLFFG